MRHGFSFLGSEKQKYAFPPFERERMLYFLSIINKKTFSLFFHKTGGASASSWGKTSFPHTAAALSFRCFSIKQEVPRLRPGENFASPLAAALGFRYF